jgi:hypothetical protein
LTKAAGGIGLFRDTAAADEDEDDEAEAVVEEE